MHYPTSGTPVPYAEVAIASGELTFAALSSGQWANNQLLVDVDVQGLDLSAATGDPLAFNLTITDLMGSTSEYLPSILLNSAAQNFVAAVVNDPDNGSQLVSVKTNLPSTPTALVVTGILGTALTITGAGSMDWYQGGGTATATADCNLVLTLPHISSTPVTIKVIRNGNSISQTVSGLAAQLQQSIANWLMVDVGGKRKLYGSASRNGHRDSRECAVAEPAGWGDYILVRRQPGAVRQALLVWELRAASYGRTMHWEGSTQHPPGQYYVHAGDDASRTTTVG